jgi:hypothetical protein
MSYRRRKSSSGANVGHGRLGARAVVKDPTASVARTAAKVRKPPQAPLALGEEWSGGNSVLCGTTALRGALQSVSWQRK